MSRTVHARPYSIFHMMRVQNRRKSEASALDQIKSESVPYRHVNRLQNWSLIPNPWDDKFSAAHREWHNKNFLTFQRVQMA